MQYREDFRFPLLPSGAPQAPTPPQGLPPHLAHLASEAMWRNAVPMTRSRWADLGTAWNLFACVGGGMCLGALGYHLLAPTPVPQIQVQKEQIIVPQEKAVIVDRNCMAFCGQKD